MSKFYHAKNQATGQAPLFPAYESTSDVIAAFDEINRNEFHEAVNKPDFQGVKGVAGAQGIYSRGNTKEGSHLVPFSVHRTTNPANAMLGCGAFYLRGDTTPSGSASEGCIIMPRAVRPALVASGGTITVVRGNFPA